MSCRRDPDPVFVDKLAKLTRLESDAEITAAIADVVRYAREHEIQYGYVMRQQGSGETVSPGDLEKHLNDELVVTIQVGEREPYKEVQWNPPANWYITRLVMP